jgi:hypothetical protein
MQQALEYNVLSVMKKPVKGANLLRAVHMLIHGMNSFKESS